MTYKILIVTHNAAEARQLGGIVQGALGYEPSYAENETEALGIIEASSADIPVDLVLLHVVLPGLSGLNLLRELRPKHPSLPLIVVMDNHAGAEHTVALIKAGAADIVPYEAIQTRLPDAIGNAFKLQSLYHNFAAQSTKTRERESSFSDIIGQSPLIQEAISLGERAAHSDIPVLLEGESGVGKELFARAIHGTSNRAGKPFVAVNCGAIPDNLVESILFGHERGAFTGAEFRTLGKFREAEGGTLFLDEISELRPDLQVKLLRALQEGEVEPVGGKKPVGVDIRVISATNQRLEEKLAQGSFREDLFYRLNVFPISVPALRDRKEDIPTLIEYYYKLFARQEQKIIIGVEPEAFRLLCAYHWPGNVRQLKNTMYRAVVICRNQQILSRQDFAHITPEHPTTISGKLEIGRGGDIIINLIGKDGHVMPLHHIEKHVITAAMSHYNGHMSEIARRLRIGRSTLYRKLDEIGLNPKEASS
ncbi:MAG: sigma-54-dependent Fis family transcriptional regulator [Rickettsiales bacterium]|jgi:DNA-binding NtrC family response regulator|nr:sigma-54-dependent Fis family transcriptional regulator [Rickettsiales bacterium]